MKLILNTENDKIVGFCKDVINIDIPYQLIEPYLYDRYKCPDSIKEIVEHSIQGKIIEIDGHQIKYVSVSEDFYGNRCDICEICEKCKENQDFMYEACLTRCMKGYYFTIVQ